MEEEFNDAVHIDEPIEPNDPNGDDNEEVTSLKAQLAELQAKNKKQDGANANVLKLMQSHGNQGCPNDVRMDDTDLNED